MQLICEVFQVPMGELRERTQMLECYRKVYGEIQRRRAEEVLHVQKTLHFLYCLFSLVRSVKNRSTLNSMREFILSQVKSPLTAAHLKELMMLTIHRLV